MNAQERRERQLESRRRGARAQHEQHVKGPRVDAYHRKRDIRAEIAAEDAERRRCKW